VGRDCIRNPGTEMVKKPPFTLLPDFLTEAIADKLNDLLDVCVTAGFTRTICAQATEEGGSERVCCWKLNRFQHPGSGRWLDDVAFSVTGLVGAEFEVSARADAIGIPELVRVALSINAGRAGYKIDRAGRHHYFPDRKCEPPACTDDSVSGIAVVELMGEMTISSSLWEFWTRSLATIVSLGGTSAAALFQSLVSIAPFMSPRPTGDFFTQRLSHIFEAGEFSVTPP